MDRRELLGRMGAGAAGLAVMGGGIAGAAQEGQHAGHQHGAHDQHLQTIHQCADICNRTADHCHDQIRQGQGSAEEHVKLHEAAMDCQAFCHLTAALMARNSAMSKHAHAACAEACAHCAEACETSSDKSELVKQCGEACRACEKVCRQMAQQSPQSPSR